MFSGRIGGNYLGIISNLCFFSQDACSSGSGESSELYNEGVTVSTRIIYNSIFEQQRLGKYLTHAQILFL